MAAYEFDDELRKYRNLRVPIFKPFLPLLQSLMGILYLTEGSDSSVIVKRKEIQTMRTLIYEPAEIRTDTLIVFLHGGGFVFNAAPHHFKTARTVAKGIGCRVLMPDYPLSPKAVFPEALEKCFGLYESLSQSPIILMGDSAGGNLAAALTLMATDKSLRTPLANVLLYPFLDSSLSTESMCKYRDTPMCSSRDMRKYLELYSPDGLGDSRYLSPLSAKDLSLFPPTYIEVAEIDPLRDEGIIFAKRLEKEGVPVVLNEVGRAMHGYDIAIKSDLVKRMTSKRLAFIENIIN